MKVHAKAFLVLGVIGATVSAAVTHYGRHQHARFHQHAGRSVETVVVNDIAIKYVFEGKEVPYEEVCQGLANGTFIWNSDVGDKPKCDVDAPSASQSTATIFSIAASSASPDALVQKASGSSSVSSSAQSSVSSSTVSSVAANSNTLGNANFLNLLQSNPGVNHVFPDGQLPCEFNSLQQYGAVPLDYLGLGGFTAIVDAVINGGSISGLTDISAGGNGNYFSYSCPEGYMKAQWPTQNSGQTVGGVLCSGGNFHLTNPNSNTLCTPGAGFVQLDSKINKVISICNTDYPATESETVPTRVAPNGYAKLSITDSGTYFKHGPNHDMTSAEYYLNLAGYDIEEACQWDSNNGQGIGNWAPVNLGLGTDSTGKMAYIGLFSAEQVLHDPASPGTPINLNYNVMVTAGSQTCEYRVENGKGNFYMNGVLDGYLGQTFHGGSVPGVTVSYLPSSYIALSNFCLSVQLLLAQVSRSLSARHGIFLQMAEQISNSLNFLIAKC